MTEEELAKIRTLYEESVTLYQLAKQGAPRLIPKADAVRYMDTQLELTQHIPALLAEVERLREIARAMAQLDLEYTDEHSEYYCPACKAFVSADWSSGRKPHGMTNKEWAVQRMKHEDDCPVIKARALFSEEG